MNFLHPALLAAGLACIAVPILIHLLMRRRRKPIVWGAMRFLVEAYQKHKRRLRLEQLLLLAARCLLVALIALALGRPILEAAGVLGGRGAVTAYLLIDNSMTASALGEDGEPALERHKAQARRVLDELDVAAGDRAGIITLGAPADPRVVPPSSDLAALRALIDALEPTESAADLEGAIARLRPELGAREPGAPSGAARTAVVLLSDFLTGSADTGRTLPAIGDDADITLIAPRPADAGAPNVSVVGIEPLRAIALTAGDGAGEGQENQVRVHLRRTGPGVGEAAISRVRLRVVGDERGGTRGAASDTGAVAGEGIVRWPAGQSEATATIAASLPEVEGVATRVLIAEIDRDAVAGDNAWRRAVETRPGLRVALVAPGRFGGGGAAGIERFTVGDWVRLALRPVGDDNAAFGSSDSIGAIDLIGLEPASLDAPRLAALDAVVITSPDAIDETIWQRLRSFTDAGGLVIVTPAPDAAVHLWTDPFLRAFALDWSIAREARVYPEPAPLSGERAAGTGRGGDDLLTLVSAELPELVKPVGVSKVLPVEAPPSSALLTLADGTPLVLAATPGEAAARRDAGGATGADPPAPAAGGEPRTDSPALRTSQRGFVVFIASALELGWTDLPAKPLMVPLMQEIVKQGVGRARGSWSDLAGSRPEAPARTAELRGRSPDGTEIVIPVDPSGQAVESIRRAGVWRAVDERGVTRALVAVNADPRAGATDPRAQAEIVSWLAPLSGRSEIQWLEAAGAPLAPDGASTATVLRREEGGSSISLPLLLAAIGIAVLELAMARWFSHAAAPRPSSDRFSDAPATPTEAA